ncbi:MAG: protein kinase [Deltaproteobacteria bacterium]|nr:protein kinase [Deltaproteobacteria bacterium]
MNPGEALSEGHLLDNRYRVRKVLGVGGMGRVYLSNDTRLANRPVAVKEMILGDGIAEKKAIEDFTREATVLARLSHPGIPTLIDHFAENSRHYMVMEFVAGGDLEKVIQQSGGKLGEDRTLRWARQILSVLEFLHSQNPPIVYRDLKPGNIMIDKEGRAMLIDFGIARFLPKGGRATQIGSPGYAPPEQYVGNVEPRSDLYSLAATMHHLLTGRDPVLEPPFSFPPVTQLAREVSSATAAAVDRALHLEIPKRFPSARAMLDALPEPTPENSAQNGHAGGSLGTMQTVVLSSPISQPPRGVRPSPPTPRSITPAPRAVPTPSSITNIPTVVLNNPSSPVGVSAAPGAVGSSETLRTIRPPVKKAIELGVRAKALIERGLRSKLVASVIQPSAPEPRPSSTAKTQELKNSAKSGAAGALASTGQSVAARTRSRTPTPPGGAMSQAPLLREGPRQETSEVRARLIVRGDETEFQLNLDRTVIGRSQSASDALDLDLVTVKRGVDRVSRRHAEIIRRGEDFFIRDLGSMNGTFIAGRGKLGRDQLYQLKDRDQVILGGAILQFRRG